MFPLKGFAFWLPVLVVIYYIGELLFNPVKDIVFALQLGIKVHDDGPISDSSINFMGKSASGPFLLLTQPGRRWIFSNKISAIHPIEIILDTNDRIVVTDDHEK